MLNNDKIRLMTKLSLYESKNESKELKAGKYYRSDYISLGLLNSAIIATLAFFIVFALIIFMNIEELLAVITTLDFLEIGKVLVSTYLIYLLAYLTIVYVVYRMRYEKMSKGIKEYDATLKELYMIYKKEANMVHEVSGQKTVEDKETSDLDEELQEDEYQDEEAEGLYDDTDDALDERDRDLDRYAEESYERDLLPEDEYEDESDEEVSGNVLDKDYRKPYNNEDEDLSDDESDGEIEISVLEEE